MNNNILQINNQINQFWITKNVSLRTCHEKIVYLKASVLSVIKNGEIHAALIRKTGFEENNKICEIFCKTKNHVSSKSVPLEAL